MSDKNLFEQALSRGETDSFFKGNGDYFVRDPDWGVHVYAALYGGHVQNFINSNSENSIIFEESFKDFVRSLKANTDDAGHFFGNLSAIIYWKKNSELSEILPLKSGACAHEEINNYIKELNASKIDDLDKNRYKVEISKYILDGYSLFEG